MGCPKSSGSPQFRQGRHCEAAPDEDEAPSLAVAPLALLEGSYCPQEIDAPEGWPKDIGKIELAERALPK
jgi:hypothetical protein